MCSVQPLLDAAGRRHSPATTPGFHTGIAPPNKGQRCPADPPTVDETRSHATSQPRSPRPSSQRADRGGSGARGCGSTRRSR